MQILSQQKGELYGVTIEYRNARTEEWCACEGTVSGTHIRVNWPISNPAKKRKRFNAERAEIAETNGSNKLGDLGV